ncbi:purine phosphorylase [Sphingomonas sp. XMGL2]|uniref:Purine phosphorylase n=1 Tax=Sphingomonas quercus TaxID=2842451 RepID=A0ABS6BK76_9SPHN|nr:purine phosphorylase [Sphingomonas quercus]MBU3078706.1 purine phosphorylase [Sphingomonas quercus]
MKDVKRIGVVTGVAHELDALLPDCPRVALGGRPPVARVDWQDKQLFLACAGIGKVAAATAATALAARHDVELLLVIGTAGKIGAADGDLFLLTEAVQADYGAQRPDGLAHYTAGTMPIGDATLRCFVGQAPEGLGLPAARIATSDLFVECGVHGARVSDRLDAALIDMETAAVAHAAELLGLPWAAIKATTDGADTDSAASFARNLERAARAAADAAARLIAGL